MNTFPKLNVSCQGTFFFPDFFCIYVYLAWPCLLIVYISVIPYRAQMDSWSDCSLAEHLYMQLHFGPDWVVYRFSSPQQDIFIIIIVVIVIVIIRFVYDLEYVFLETQLECLGILCSFSSKLCPSTDVLFQEAGHL